jgi:hypothetical protein
MISVTLPGHHRCSRPQPLNLLAHRRKQTRHLSAVALNDVGELRPVAQRHADPRNDNIGDLIAAVPQAELPINLNRRALWANDLADYDDPAGSGRLPITLNVSPPYWANRCPSTRTM